jgi:hypothetical protein
MRAQTLLSGLKLMLVLLCFGQSVQATPLEPPVEDIIRWIETNDKISLSPVSDDLDALWELLDEPGTVQARARYAGYSNVFGLISGADGFQALPGVTINNGIITHEDPASSIALPDITGQFRLAIRTPEDQIWSSLAGENIDLLDHMVTWVDDNDPYHYFVAFEDLPFPGSDGDFNDLVLELHNVLDAPVPEPVTLSLLGVGLATLIWSRRRRV